MHSSRNAQQLRFAVLLLLVAVGVSTRAAPPLLLAEATYPPCTRALIGQPCPGVRASECIDVGKDQAPRCVSKCSTDSDCTATQSCLPLGRGGPKRCVPKGFTPPPDGC